ncbi:MAG: hypothetical protein E7447_04045, partial [Ruminococcaceae bacterium]|nr:hypothetical protein [Oscillospiraceae bacterium]
MALSKFATAFEEELKVKHLKRIISLCLLATMLLGLFSGIPALSISAVGGTSNPVVDEDGKEVINLMADMNPDFEQVPVIPGWSTMYGISQSTQHVYDDGGVWSLKMADNSASEALWSQSDKNALDMGKDYKISAQVYGDVGTLTIFFYDANGNELPELKKELSTLKASDSWQTLSYEFTAAASSIAVKLSTTEAGTGTVWFDSVILESVVDTSFVPSVPNGDFNAAWVGSEPDKWNFNSKKAALSNFDKGNGDTALAIDTTVSKAYQLSTDRFPVMGGQPYMATIQIKQTAEMDGQLYIRFYETETSSAVLAAKYVTFSGKGTTEDWVTIAVNEIAPAKAKFATLVLASPWCGAGTTYYDNAQVVYATEIYNPSYESKNNQSNGGPMGVGFDHKIQAVSTDAAHTGEQSLLTNKGSFWDTFRIKAKPGEEYEASAWVRMEKASAEAYNCSILLYFYDENGKEIKKQQLTSFKPTMEWQELKIKSKAPDNAVAVKAMVYMTSGSGKVYFDDISITQLTDYNMPRNFMTNGGFESRTIELSSPIPGIDGISSSVADLLGLEYVDAQYGYAARIHSTNYAQTLTDWIPVEAGKTYSFAVEAKGEGRLQAFVRYYTDNTVKHTAYMKDASGTDLGKLNSTANLSDDEWTQLFVSTSVAPEGAKYARVWICGIWDTDTNKVDLVYDNINFFEGIPEIKIPGELGVLRNSDFEAVDKKGAFKDWFAYGNPVHSVMDAKTNPDDVFEGRYAIKITDYKETSGSKGVHSGLFPVEEGMTYRFSGYVMENYDQGMGFQMVIRFFNKAGDRLANFYVNTPATGEWNYCDVSGSAPTGAVSAYVMLLSGGGNGEACFDKLEFTALSNNEYAPVMEDLEWNFAYDEYPRIYLSKERLEEVRKFTKSKSVCAYGYAGTVTLKSLLSSADVFLEETSMRITYAKGVAIDYPMYPVLEDPSMRPEWEIPPEGYTVYPYFTAYGQNMVRRMQTLTLAYALTGDVRYGERAKQYALDICNFKWWIGYYHTVVQEGHVEWSSQPSGYMLDCVMMAYDLCHDMFTADELAIMEENMLEELENEYHDCWPRMSKDRDMDHATGLILASCLMMREDNIDQLKKYLDMGMTYINWRLNYNYLSNVNEGHSYDSLAIDDIVVTMATMERVTGNTGPMDHPYIKELEKIITGQFDPVNGELPAYSDSNYSSGYYPYSAAIFSQQGNELATYYLAIGGALSSAFEKLIYFTDISIAELEMPDEREGNVTFVDCSGYGALRTGWDILDSMLTVNANNSQKDHNHYDQLSIQLAFNGTWMLSDSEYKDNSMSPLTYWQMKYTNSTIFVDGKPQVRKGQGTLEQVFDTHIYGYLKGSAPDAYGMEDKQQVLNKFDRHMIMINHDSKPYYVIIDDLDSNKERNFGWNFYTNGWDRLEVDGQHVAEGAKITGNRVVISRFGNTIHSIFVGDSVTTREVTFSGYGPTMVLETEKKSNHQFMNILSTEKGSGSQISTMFEPLMIGESSTDPKNDREGEINWSSTRTDTTKNTLLSVSIGSRLVMFRAGEVGDWCKFPFEVPKTKEYRVAIDVGQTMTYSGTWDLYVDDQKITTFKPNGPSGVINIEAGSMNLEAGQHFVKIVLADTPETPFGGTICSVGGITLDTGESMGEGTVKVTEQYNEGDLLGATITYGPVLKDVVVFNRGTGEISGGGLTTNGQQASVIGINGIEIAEGYAVTNGTSLKYGSQVLMTSEGPVSIAMDYTMAKFPVKNDLTENPVEIHEDFDIEKPIYYVSSKADAATVVSVNVGIHAPYTVTINGQKVESSHSGEMLTFTVPAGAAQITIEGTHQHIFDQHATNILNIKEWAGCGHNNVYYVSCVCGENGTETF